jgi:hypothetical protein
MFSWLNRNPTNALPIRRNQAIVVDLDRRTVNDIPVNSCMVADLSSLGKATGYVKYATGYRLSYRESGVEFCLNAGKLDVVTFSTSSDYSPGMSACKATVIFHRQQVIVGQATSANELIGLLGDPFVAAESKDDLYDVEWHGTGWILSCEFDRNAGLNFFDVSFSENGV